MLTLRGLRLGFVKLTWIDPGKASTPAHAAPPEHRARGAIRSMMALTDGCRKVLRLNSTRKDGAISNRGAATKAVQM
jgi:hypothetical protein